MTQESAVMQANKRRLGSLLVAPDSATQLLSIRIWIREILIDRKEIC